MTDYQDADQGLRMQQGATRGTVLVVEDEVLIRMDAAYVLEDAGFEAIEAANADEALLILEDRPDIDVVFTDVNMPGSMDGLTLSRRIKDRRPDIAVIITSGMARLASSTLPPRTMFFDKPYNFDRILTAINSLVTH